MKTSPSNVLPAEAPANRNGDVILVNVSNKRQRKLVEHDGGQLEFGRGPERGVKRCVIDDPEVSRDQLLIELTDGDELRIANLSQRVPVYLAGGQEIDCLEERILPLPVQLTVGLTTLDIARPAPGPSTDTALATIQTPTVAGKSSISLSRLLADVETPDSSMLMEWFEAVVAVQQAVASSSEFFEHTARALIDIVGLDCGCVILRQDSDWQVVGQAKRTPYLEFDFSRSILNRVLDQRRTFFQENEGEIANDGLENVGAIVASPIMSENDDEVIGVVYGCRRRTNEPISTIKPLEAQMVQVLATAVSAGLARLAQQAESARHRIQFEQFFSPKLARALDGNPQLLEGREKDVTILFVDVRGFTRLSAKLEPTETFSFMADLMGCLTAEVTRYDGVIIDYYGDGLMAMWNAPTDQPHHADLACHAALGMEAELPTINARWEGRIDTTVRLGIGINTGPAMVGNVGSPQKFKYGAMGLTVNTTQRIEAATRDLGVGILISADTRAALVDKFDTRRVCKAKLRGVPDAQNLYELKAEDADNDWREIREIYDTALLHYEAGNWSEASQSLSLLLAIYNENLDPPSLMLMTHTLDCLRSPPDSFSPILMTQPE